LKHALKIEADKISASARAKIDKVGGTIALRETRLPENAKVTEKETLAESAPQAAKPASRKKSAAKTGRQPKKATSGKS
jgi:hypothetical protein